MPQQSKPARETYHHGNLHAALLDVAEELLDEGGPEAVGLREAARRAGVSPTAAYRHFTDKEAFHAALAVRGFNAFAAAMSDAAANMPEGPLPAMGQAYVKFAVSRPGRFRLMFGPSVADRARHPELQAAIERASVAFRGAVVSRPVDANGTPASAASAEPAELTMLRYWASMHGLAQLWIDGMLPGSDAVALARALTTKVKG